jgi:hypothetical protein
MADLKTTIKSSLDDEHGSIEVTIKVRQRSVQLTPQGCSEDFGVVDLEYHEGKPRLLVYADINKDQPTHIIDLSGAKISNRKED